MNMIPDALPSCFRERDSHTLSITTSNSSSSSKSVQNLVTCLYKTAISGKSRMVSVTWCKSLMGQGLSVSLDYPSCKQTCSVNMKPWRFRKKQGSKSVDMGAEKMEIFWDLSSAKYMCGPEPQAAFYVAITCNHEAILVLGDMHKEALKKLQAQVSLPNATLLSRKEHVYGKQLYTTKAHFCETGRAHDIAIECHVGAETDAACLSVRVDKQIVIHVTSLMWKFRGNQTIKIDGTAVEVYWDVHNWLFKAEEEHAVFMFNTYVVHDEKPRLSDAGVPFSIGDHSPTNVEKPHMVSDVLWASVLKWPTVNNSPEKEQGFSLLLYAWNSA